jgi:hypothetical protein
VLVASRNGNRVEVDVLRRRNAISVVLVSFVFWGLSLTPGLQAQYLFEPSICVAGGEEGQTSPSLSVDSWGNPCIAYVNNRSPWSIEFIRSTDGGKTFLDPVWVAWDRPYVHPSLALYQDSPYLAYRDAAPAAKDVYFTRSTDGGESFLPPMLIGKTDGEFELALDQEGNPFIACHDSPYIIVYRSTDGGESFLDPVTADSLTYFFHFLNLAIDSLGNPHVAWVAGPWWEMQYLYYVRSTDRGESFLSSLCLDDETSQNSDLDLQIAGCRDPGIVWCAFQKDKDQYQLNFSRSTDGGTSFLPFVMVDTIASKNHPSMQFDPQGNPLVAWSDSRCGIYFTHSTDGGITFLPGAPVDSTGHSQDSPTLGLAPYGITVHVAWNDGRQERWGDIFYTRGLPAGINEELSPFETTTPFSVRAYPNPFRYQVTILLTQVPQDAEAVLSIYNTAGQAVYTRSVTAAKWGQCRIHWDGRSDRGLIQPCGVYLCRLSGGGENLAIKLLKLE